MAFDVSGLSAYSEEHLFDLIAASTAGAKTVNLVTVQSGVKGSAKINLLDSPVTFQEDDCAWNASGTTTLTQRTITAYDIKINESLCPKDLVGKYTQVMLKAGANEEGKDIPFEE